MNEVRLFSDTLAKSKHFYPALISGSVSRADANLRLAVYQKIFSQYNELKEAFKLFSGYSEVPLLSNQYFNASITSYVQSFAGYLSIERSMDQQTALLYYLDVLNALTEEVILPNIGAESLGGLSSKIESTVPMIAGTASYSTILGKKVIPGSVTISLVITGSTPVIITDDRSGNFMAGPGVLTVNDEVDGAVPVGIDYTNGTITFKVGDGFTIPGGGASASIVAFEDAPGVPNTGGAGVYANRFKTSLRNITVATAPDMLIAENNLIALAAMQKSVGLNASEFQAAKLVELFTKLINRQLVASINGTYTAVDSITIDITKATTGFLDFRSQLDKFSASLIDVDGALAEKSIKGVRATAYVCGLKMADQFRKLKDIGKFTDNPANNYVNDLIGFYDNTIPVLRHTDIATGTGFAIHKTPDGQLAPTIRGIFLPLTNTPAVGNYNNPTQISQGVFYQEGIKSITQQLTQKFTLTTD